MKKNTLWDHGSLDCLFLLSADLPSSKSFRAFVHTKQTPIPTVINNGLLIKTTAGWRFILRLIIVSSIFVYSTFKYPFLLLNWYVLHCDTPLYAHSYRQNERCNLYILVHHLCMAACSTINYSMLTDWCSVQHNYTTWFCVSRFAMNQTQPS